MCLRFRLLTSMADLVHDFTEDAPGLSPSEIASFCQCCRTIDFEGQALSDTGAKVGE